MRLRAVVSQRALAAQNVFASTTTKIEARSSSCSVLLFFFLPFVGDTFSRPSVGVGRVEVFLLLATRSTHDFLAVDGVPVSYWHDECTDADLNKFGLKRSDCRGQAVWEVLALLGVIRSSALVFGLTPRRRWELSRKSVQNPL